MTEPRFKSREEYERWKIERLASHTPTESPSSGGPLKAGERATDSAVELRPSSPRSSSALQPIGFALLGLGFAIVMFFFALFDTSVKGPFGDRVNNLGLMNQRQNGIIVGALVCMVGLALTVVAQLQALRPDSESSGETGMPSQVRIEDMTKKCPDCAETIKLEAVVCRFCGHKFEPEAVQAVVEQARVAWQQKEDRKIPTAKEREMLDGGMCAKCGAYMAFKLDASKTLWTCEVCKKTYSLA